MEQIKKLTDAEILKVSKYIELKGGIDSFYIRRYLRLNNSINRMNNILSYDKIMKSIKLIIKTLSVYGFSEVESFNFINKNKFLMIEQYNELRMKFAILNKVGLLDSVLFNNPRLLHRLVRPHLTSRRMYSLVTYLSFNSKEVTLSEIFGRVYSHESYEWLCSNYRLSESEKTKLLNDFDKFLLENKSMKLK